MLVYTPTLSVRFSKGFLVNCAKASFVVSGVFEGDVCPLQELSKTSIQRKQRERSKEEVGDIKVLKRDNEMLQSECANRLLKYKINVSTTITEV